MTLRNPILRKVVLCLGLEVAALMGAPLRPDEMEDLLRSRQQDRIECACREDSICDSGAEPVE
jgi:hypothetical protein